MRAARIRVKVEQGMFPSERTVSFQIGGKSYTLIVDAADVQGDMLTVYVVEQGEREALVDLPRETFTTGNRIRIPNTHLVAA
jgi:hypothetical protein